MSLQYVHLTQELDMIEQRIRDNEDPATVTASLDALVGRTDDFRQMMQAGEWSALMRRNASLRRRVLLPANTEMDAPIGEHQRRRTKYFQTLMFKIFQARDLLEKANDMESLDAADITRIRAARYFYDTGSLMTEDERVHARASLQELNEEVERKDAIYYIGQRSDARDLAVDARLFESLPDDVLRDTEAVDAVFGRKKAENDDWYAASALIKSNDAEFKARAERAASFYGRDFDREMKDIRLSYPQMRSIPDDAFRAIFKASVVSSNDRAGFNDLLSKQVDYYVQSSADRLRLRLGKKGRDELRQRLYIKEPMPIGASVSWAKAEKQVMGKYDKLADLAKSATKNKAAMKAAITAAKVAFPPLAPVPSFIMKFIMKYIARKGAAKGKAKLKKIFRAGKKDGITGAAKEVSRTAKKLGKVAKVLGMGEEMIAAGIPEQEAWRALYAGDAHQLAVASAVLHPGVAHAMATDDTLWKDWSEMLLGAPLKEPLETWRATYDAIAEAAEKVEQSMCANCGEETTMACGECATSLCGQKCIDEIAHAAECEHIGQNRRFRGGSMGRGIGRLGGGWGKRGGGWGGNLGRGRVGKYGHRRYGGILGFLPALARRVYYGPYYGGGYPSQLYYNLGRAAFMDPRLFNPNYYYAYPDYRRPWVRVGQYPNRARGWRLADAQTNAPGTVPNWTEPIWGNTRPANEQWLGRAGEL